MGTTDITVVKIEDFSDESSKITTKPAKKRAKPCKKRPAPEVQYDGINHWCKYSDGQVRCKYPGCQLKTRAFCSKCNLNLCNNPLRNCFVKFHTLENCKLVKIK